MILKAEKGFRYTNGTAFGRTIVLGNGASADEWYLITEKEYQEIKRKQAEEDEE